MSVAAQSPFVLAQRGRGRRAGGLVSFLARRGRTIRMCSLDARSRRKPDLAHEMDDRERAVGADQPALIRIESSPRIKIERRQAASKPVAFNASPRFECYSCSDRPANFECPRFPSSVSFPSQIFDVSNRRRTWRWHCGWSSAQ